MRTTVIIPDNLLKDAMKLTGANTKKEAILTALKKLVTSGHCAEMKSLFGKVKIDLDTEKLEKLEIREAKKFGKIK